MEVSVCAYVYVFTQRPEVDIEHLPCPLSRVFLGRSPCYFLEQGTSLNPELIYSTNSPSPLAMGSSVPPPRSWDCRQAMTPPSFYGSGGILTLA